MQQWSIHVIVGPLFSTYEVTRFFKDECELSHRAGTSRGVLSDLTSDMSGRDILEHLAQELYGNVSAQPPWALD